MNPHQDLAPRVTAWDWQLAAACRHRGGAVFFAPAEPESHQQRSERQAQAKAVCAECPVRPACLQHALTVGEPYGIWGGLTPGERRRHLPSRRARRVAAGTSPAVASPGQYSEG